MNEENPVLYTKLDKALYGTLQAALLFWEKPRGSRGIHVTPVSQTKRSRGANAPSLGTFGLTKTSH